MVGGLILVSGVLGDFQIRSDYPSQHSLVGGGADAYFAIEVRSLNGFRGIVTMSATASAGASATLRGFNSLNPAVVLGINDTDFLTVKTTTIGNYTVTVTGTSGIFSHTIDVMVLAQGVSFSTTQNPLMIPRNSSGNTTLTIKSLNGLTGVVRVDSNLRRGTNNGPSGCGCSSNLTFFSPGLNQVCPDYSACALSQLSRGGAVAVTLIAGESGYTYGISFPFTFLITIDGLAGELTYDVQINFA